MGFYGNITNTSNTTFQFDRIYPNRLNMDSNVNNDGIFIGRYVLVEYQQNAAYPIVYIKDNQFYSSPNCEDVTRIKFLHGDRKDNTDENNDGYFDGVYKDEFVQTQQIGGDKTTIKFYQCIGNDGEYAVFTEATPDTSKSNYITNFGIDEYHYSNEKGFKGYDSTVWVKTSVTTNDGKLITKYVNIADLNSVVPTFDIAADAPTMNPITPHFDADSTNVYYKLHMQSPYGFRVKKGVLGQSDDDTTWYKTTYYKDEDKTETKLVYSGPADIYYNQAGFDPNNANSKVSNKAEDNYIKLEPTGRSDAQYSHGNDTNDIQEFSLHLPAIGNMMSDAWDIIHGPDRDDYKGQWKGENDSTDYSSLQGRLNALSDLQVDEIPVKRLRDGQIIGSKINGGKSEQEIYGSLDDAWIQTLVDGNTNTISIHHTFNSNKNGNSYSDIRNKQMPDNDTDNNINLNDGTNTLDINTPIIDATGHVVGKNTETVTLPYGFKTIATNGRGTSITENASTTPSKSNIVAESTQDTLSINSGNRWIRMDTNATNDTLTIVHDIHETSNSTTEASLSSETAVTTFEVPTYSFDEAGHYESHDTKTLTMPFGYGKITGDSGSTSASATFDTLAIIANDSWIQTAASTDKVNITHTGPVVGTPTEVNDVEPEFGETFSITDWHYDNKGHKYGSTNHTVKIPNGSYTPADSVTTHTDIITSIGFTPSTGAITSTKATTDTLTLSNYSANSGNLNIVYTDTINKGLEKIQNYINSLDMESISDSQIIKSIKQIDGQISVERAAAGTLVLGTESTDKTVSATDSLNSAINKIEARIKTEEENRKNAINTLYGNNGETIAETFDTIKEIADWLDGNSATGDTGVEKLISDINTNKQAISDEVIRADLAEKALGTRIDNLDYEKTKVNNYYISSIKQTNGLIEVGTTLLPIRTVTSGVENGTILVNNSAINVGGLKSAAYTESSAYALASQGKTADDTANTIATYGDIVKYNADEFVSKEEYNALLEDYNALKELVDQLNTQLNPESGEEPSI